MKAQEIVDKLDEIGYAITYKATTDGVVVRESRELCNELTDMILALQKKVETYLD